MDHVPLMASPSIYISMTRRPSMVSDWMSHMSPSRVTDETGKLPKPLVEMSPS